jgi:hypothetical protein
MCYSPRPARGLARFHRLPGCGENIPQTLSLATVPHKDHAAAAQAQSTAFRGIGNSRDPKAPRIDASAAPSSARSDLLTSKIRPNNVFFFELLSALLFCVRQEVLAHVYSSC